MADEPQNLPVHVAIIMDGNGRWAQARGLPRREGHMQGSKSVRAVARGCINLGIPYLTLYAFSTENWSRPETEVQFLMGHLRKFLIEKREEMLDEGIRLSAIGRLHELPEGVQEALQETVNATAKGDKLNLTLALNYGGHAEITDACRKIGQSIARGEIDPADVTEQLVSENIYTAGVPNPDLLIRTAGEMRVSNFLLWQISYAEIVVADVLWPDFDEEILKEAVEEFAERERRFGGIPDTDGNSGK
ncbi:MAG: polyprenyl diphosphate synthase [Candidatus Brocadiia bacterium]